MIKDLASALNSLHTMKIAHGGLHPRNVLLTSDNRVLLSAFDVSKTPVRCHPEYANILYLYSLISSILFDSLQVQRLESPFEDNGLRFIDPRTRRNSLDPANDMFCLGMLALWLFCPTTTFNTDHRGHVQLGKLESIPMFMQRECG